MLFSSDRPEFAAFVGPDLLTSPLNDFIHHAIHQASTGFEYRNGAILYSVEARGKVRLCF